MSLLDVITEKLPLFPAFPASSETGGKALGCIQILSGSRPLLGNELLQMLSMMDFGNPLLYNAETSRPDAERMRT